jgi:DNA repair protein RadB
MVDEKITTGCRALDEVLHGGISRGEITLIYGEAATGKTTTAIQTATYAAKHNLKVLYVDSDRSFTQQRFHQISGHDSHQLSELIMLFFPDTFGNQRSLV